MPPDNHERKAKDQRLTWNPKDVFTGTTWHYARYRPSYPPKIIETIRRSFSLDGQSRVLDLGCGTGQLALKLAPYVLKVIAVDPQEEMLHEGKKLAAKRKVTNIRWICGESGDLSSMASQIGKIDCTVIGRAFHWMDQEQTLSELYEITKPGGGIVIVADSGPQDIQVLRWKEVIKETVTEWLGEERRAGKTGIYQNPGKLHQDVLKESEFRDTRVIVIKSRRMWSIDRIIGYVYSTSYASWPVLGEKREPFEADLRRRLAAVEPARRFQEEVNTVAIMAWK